MKCFDYGSAVLHIRKTEQTTNIANQKHRSVFICEEVLFFHILYIFFYTQIPFVFCLLGDFCMAHDHIIAFCFSLHLPLVKTLFSGKGTSSYLGHKLWAIVQPGKFKNNTRRFGDASEQLD